jgi:hypothetical protein
MDGWAAVVMMVMEVVPGVNEAVFSALALLGSAHRLVSGPICCRLPLAACWAVEE